MNASSSLTRNECVAFGLESIRDVPFPFEDFLYKIPNQESLYKLTSKQTPFYKEFKIVVDVYL